ncbi:MAG TPA: HAD-IIA family hydrolase [Solirubrobacterales bacterium]|nr:HAD-IIA family hydrolase [Solirubrobacterales bacterium]
MDQFDGFLVDLDGVVWVGHELVPGSAEALRELIGSGKEIVFVTNNPGRPAADYAKRLREAGVPATAERVVTAGEATARLAAERAGRGSGAFVIGAPAFHETVAAAGLETLDGEAAREAVVVVVSGHRGFDYEELLTATLALQRGAALVATSRDPTLPMPGGAWPGTGAVLAAVETASGARAAIGGKPETHLFELARERIAGARRVAMVGDRVSSDIEGGRRAGLETILVLSGATSREEASAAEPKPDHVIDHLADLAAG